MHPITDTELKTISDWQNARASQFLLDDSQRNVDIVIPICRSKGGINPRSLDEAVQISLRSLSYMPGHEPAIIKQELAEKAQSERDKTELEKKRKRDAEVLAGRTPQRNVKTEFDRLEANKATETQTVPLVGVDSPKFIHQNLEAKATFEDLCARGPITYRNNREDRAKSEERRAELQAIRIVAAQKDKNGLPVLIYSKMVEKAQQIVARFEQEDSRREM
jgi:hypothetical protein